MEIEDQILYLKLDMDLDLEIGSNSTKIVAKILFANIDVNIAN